MIRGRYHICTITKNSNPSNLILFISPPLVFHSLRSSIVARLKSTDSFLPFCRARLPKTISHLLSALIDPPTSSKQRLCFDILLAIIMPALQSQGRHSLPLKARQLRFEEHPRYLSSPPLQPQDTRTNDQLTRKEILNASQRTFRVRKQSIAGRGRSQAQISNTEKVRSMIGPEWQRTYANIRSSPGELWRSHS
jgi:hypothetical protein